MTQNNKYIPSGYKDSPLGVIPQEWEVKRLGELGGIVSGLTYSPDDIRDNGILVLRSSNVQNRQLCFDDNVYVDVESFNPVIENDILICVRNGSRNLIGKNALITKEIEGVAFGAFMSVFRSPYSGYLFQLFDTDYFYKRVHQNLGATINSINGSDLQDFRFPIPPLGEQRRIAEVLGCWDKAIERQGRMVALLTTRKHALMQRLLAPQPHWQTVSYAGILKKVKRSLKWNDDELYRLISVKRRSGGLFERESLYGRDIKTKNLRPAHEGDFLISRMQIVHGASGLTTHKFHDMKISGSYIALIAKNANQLDVNYLNWHSKTPRFYHQTYISSFGVHIEKMTFDLDSFMALGMKLPPLDEQKAIAEKLSTADAQINLARRRLDLLCTQKRALMQQLLTGKKRLKQ